MALFPREDVRHRWVVAAFLITNIGGLHTLVAALLIASELLGAQGLGRAETITALRHSGQDVAPCSKG